MNTSTESSLKRTTLCILTIGIGLVSAAANAASQTPTKDDSELKQQIAELQAKVRQLEAAQSSHSPRPAASPQMAGMSPSASAPMSMGMGEMKMGEMKNMSSSDQNEMTDMMNMMGMMKDMKMGGMAPGSSGMAAMPKSALPGFPGVSHLYHIGATGFFLDHADHINLTPDQQTALNHVKQQALNAKSHSEHQIEQAEQELANLTSADQPDAVKIDQKVREIEKLRSDERLAFIRSVGNSAKLLTEDQRKILTGAMQPATPAPSPSAAMSPMSEM